MIKIDDMTLFNQINYSLRRTEKMTMVYLSLDEEASLLVSSPSPCQLLCLDLGGPVRHIIEVTSFSVILSKKIEKRSGSLSTLEDIFILKNIILNLLWIKKLYFL